MMYDFTLSTGGFASTTVMIRPHSQSARERLGFCEATVSAQYRKSDGFELVDTLIAEGWKVHTDD